MSIWASAKEGMTFAQKQNLAIAISNTHSHANKLILDTTEASYTSAEKIKLGNLTDSFKGVFVNKAAILAAYGAPSAGWSAWNSETSTIWAVSNSIWVNSGIASIGNMLQSVYDPQSIGGDAFRRSNHTGSQLITTITNLSSASVDLSGNVTLPANLCAMTGIFTGTVGVGTTSPTCSLTLGDSSCGTWDSNYRVIDLLGCGTILGSHNGTGWSGTGYGQTAWANNTYYNGTSKAIGTGAASSILQGTGQIEFQVAPSVSAGATQTFISAMHINNNGRVGIGTTAPTAALQVVGLAEYTNNATAIAAGLNAGAFYRTGEVVKVVY